MSNGIAPKICVRDYGTDSIVLEVSNSNFYNGKVKISIENMLIQYFECDDISYHKVNSNFEDTLYNYGRKKLILHRNKLKSKNILGCMVQ